MELLPLSKFKLQLLSLISEVRNLREREQMAREDLRRLIQNHRQTELEFERKIQGLQSELASSEELQRKLESKVKYLEIENTLLEKKQEELKETIDNLLRSRESFLTRYEESTCEMKHSIETRDKRLALLSEKLHAHLLLFSSIEKEAVTVKQIVDDVQHLVSEKEQAVSALRKKMVKVSTFEKQFVEKICFLENNIKHNQDEIRKRDMVILDLKEQVESAKCRSDLQPQIEELQKALAVKEESIQHLTAEKEALRFEVQSLAFVLQRIQETIISTTSEDHNAVPTSLGGHEECTMISHDENNRVDNRIECGNGNSQHKDQASGAAETLPLHQESCCMNKHSSEKHLFDSCTSESASSGPQSMAHMLSTPVDEKKESSTLLIHQPDSECSTTEAEASEKKVAEQFRVIPANAAHMS